MLFLCVSVRMTLGFANTFIIQLAGFPLRENLAIAASKLACADVRLVLLLVLAHFSSQQLLFVGELFRSSEVENSFTVFAGPYAFRDQ